MHAHKPSISRIKRRISLHSQNRATSYEENTLNDDNGDKDNGDPGDLPLPSSQSFKYLAKFNVKFMLNLLKMLNLCVFADH